MTPLGQQIYTSSLISILPCTLPLTSTSSSWSGRVFKITIVNLWSIVSISISATSSIFIKSSGIWNWGCCGWGWGLASAVAFSKGFVSTVAVTGCSIFSSALVSSTLVSSAWFSWAGVFSWTLEVTSGFTFLGCESFSSFLPNNFLKIFIFLRFF